MFTCANKLHKKNALGAADINRDVVVFVEQTAVAARMTCANNALLIRQVLVQKWERDANWR